MPIFDFGCMSCGAKEEKLLPSRQEYGVCSLCNGRTCCLVSCPQIRISGTDPDFPTAWHSWEKKRNQKMKQEAKQDN